MPAVRYVIAALIALLGLVWIGQGFNLIKGSGMSGQPFWALVGFVLVGCAAFLAWRGRRPAVR